MNEQERKVYEALKRVGVNFAAPLVDIQFNPSAPDFIIHHPNGSTTDLWWVDGEVVTELPKAPFPMVTIVQHDPSEITITQGNIRVTWTKVGDDWRVTDYHV